MPEHHPALGPAQALAYTQMSPPLPRLGPAPLKIPPLPKFYTSLCLNSAPKDKVFLFSSFRLGFCFTLLIQHW